MPNVLKCVQTQEVRRAARIGSLNMSRSLQTAVNLAILLSFAVIPAVRSQSTGIKNGSDGSQSPSSSGAPDHPEHPRFEPALGDDGTSDPVMTERRVRALNMVRQKLLVQDTNKLFRLAKELNQEVAATNPSAWTPDQLHKIAEIEKLAHSVRERMAMGVGEPSPSLFSPTVAFPN
jgi:hypothetical protein